MTKSDIDNIVENVVEMLKINSKDESVLIEASGRHVHLSREHVEQLFGKGYELTKKRDLSQPGQFLCEEKVTVIGKKGSVHNVSILGPVRDKSQVELSMTDALSIGVKAPVRMSGDIDNSGTAVIATPNAVVRLNEGVITAKRHLHITPTDALKYKVANNEEVYLKIDGERGTVFINVTVRVSDKYKTAVHLDYDEANAFGFKKGMRGKLIK